MSDDSDESNQAAPGKDAADCHGPWIRRGGARLQSDEARVTGLREEP